MIIGMELGNGYGAAADSWRAPGVDPADYLDYDVRIRHARAAERGKLQFLFFPNGPHHVVDIEHFGPQMTPDLIVHSALLARATERIGFVVSASAIFNYPYTLAQQLKTVDYISHGRVAWNVVASAHPEVAANFGSAVLPGKDRYGRAWESVELVQSLWASWGRDAWTHDQAAGQYTRPGGVKPVDFAGNYVTSRGPLYIPPSDQGQPVMVHSGLGPDSFRLAGRCADLVVGLASSIEDARSQRETLRRYTAEAGRDPDGVKFIAGFYPTVARTKREAIERRVSLLQSQFPQLVPQLGELLGVPLTMDDLDRVLEPDEIGALRPPHPDMPIWEHARIPRAHALASEGWSVRDILALGVFDEHPAKVGTATEAADHMQEWFESGAIDGFWIIIDVYDDGIDSFVDNVVPILQNRGLFHRDYEGTTLREHLGAREQYGPDYRVAQTARPEQPQHSTLPEGQ
ncbi:NtaA/DmoA family FMN-dependent monooxygenase [Nocardia mangyaensis]|nr:NtaA/DmoA family FMN-dependent monooxygenase [Nocardia mangyaensis]